MSICQAWSTAVGRIRSTRLGRDGRCQIFGRLRPSSRMIRYTVLRSTRQPRRCNSAQIRR
jgi:hypothetical protein